MIRVGAIRMAQNTHRVGLILMLEKNVIWHNFWKQNKKTKLMLGFETTTVVLVEYMREVSRKKLN